MFTYENTLLQVVNNKVNKISGMVSARLNSLEFLNPWIMKARIATLMLAVGMLLSTTAIASQPVQASKAVSKSVAELFSKKIDYPDFARVDDFNCCVLVRLTITEEGGFEVDCANCQDDRLEWYVKDNIEKIISKDYAQYAGQSVSLKINFKLID
jgi:hypothetical protein